MIQYTRHGEFSLHALFHKGVLPSALRLARERRHEEAREADHVREYGPRIADFAFNRWTPPRTLTAHGRSWWESPNSSDEESNVRGGRNVSDRMTWPADGVVKSKTGIPFRLAGLVVATLLRP